MFSISIGKIALGTPESYGLSYTGDDKEVIGSVI